MPGLLRGVARTAVVAGTASAVGNRVTRRQAAKWGNENYVPGTVAVREQEPAGYAQAPPPPAAPEDPMTAKLNELAGLHARGVLTDEEFTAAKQRVLQS